MWSRAVLLLVVSAASLQGQETERAQNRDLLPLRSAKVTAELGRYFASEWDRGASRIERLYCVTRWRLEFSRDGDTVYVAEAATPAPTQRRGRDVVTGECRDSSGRFMPTAHSHPDRDCTASRADIHRWVARDAEFDLALCGPGAIASYDARIYRLASAGYARLREP